MFKKVWKTTLLIFIFFSLILSFGFRQHGSNNQVIKSKNKVATKNIYYVIKLGNKEHKFKSKKEILKFIMDNYQIKSKTFIGEKRILNDQMVLDTNSDTTFGYKGIKTFPAYKDIYDNYVDNKNLMINSYIPNYAIYRRYYDLNNNEFETKEDAINSIIKNVEKKATWTGYYDIDGSYFNPFNQKSIAKLKQNIDNFKFERRNFIDAGNYLIDLKTFNDAYKNYFESAQILKNINLNNANIFKITIGLKPYYDNYNKNKNLYVFKYDGPYWRQDVDSSYNYILSKNVSLSWLENNIYGSNGFFQKYKAYKDHRNWFFEIGHHKGKEKYGEINREDRFNRGNLKNWTNYTQYLSTKKSNQFLDFNKFEILPNYDVWKNDNKYDHQWKLDWDYPSSVFNNYRANSKHDIVFNLKINADNLIKHMNKKFFLNTDFENHIIKKFDDKLENSTNLSDVNFKNSLKTLIESNLIKFKKKILSEVNKLFKNSETIIQFNDSNLTMSHKKDNFSSLDIKLASFITKGSLQDNSDWKDGQKFMNTPVIGKHIQSFYFDVITSIINKELMNTSYNKKTILKYNNKNVFLEENGLFNISYRKMYGEFENAISLNEITNISKAQSLSSYVLGDSSGVSGFNTILKKNNMAIDKTLFLGSTTNFFMAKVFEQSGDNKIESLNPIYNQDYTFLTWLEYNTFINLLKENKIFPSMKYSVNGLESILASKGIILNNEIVFNSKQSLLRNYRLVLRNLINKSNEKLYVLYNNKKYLIKSNFYNGWYSNFYAKDIYYNSYNDIISSYEKYINENSIKIQEEIYV